MEVNRSGLYKARRPRLDRDEQLRALMDPIIEHFAGYGYRRVTEALVRQGFVVNHKRVLRIMRQNGWLCRLRSRRIHTTQSDHGLGVFPNLAQSLQVTRINQLWVADLTYIRLRDEFIYLAVILDAHSRRVLSWELGRRLDARLTLAALERALALRGDVDGLIHHSDQGVQYAAHEYVQRAQAAGLVLSMSRRGQPRDNARMESFFATLKAEEVRLTEYRDPEDARASLTRFIDDLYNTKRLHSALGYVPPLEFESAERSTPILRSGADSNSVSPQGFADAMPNLSLPPALRDALYLPEPTNPLRHTVY
jgi:transposase InsO family protein